MNSYNEAPTSAERPIGATASAQHCEGMNEATIDCGLCGSPAVLEYRLEDLDDTANWVYRNHWLACARHQDAFQIDSKWLTGNQRVIIQHCG